MCIYIYLYIYIYIYIAIYLLHNITCFGIPLITYLTTHTERNEKDAWGLK